MPWIRRAAINIMLSLMAIAVSLVAAEIVLKFTGFRRALLSPSIFRYYRPDDRKGYDIDVNVPPVIHQSNDVSYKVWSNELGCFDTPYRGEKNYILLLGDSFTWGYAPFEDKFGTVIENKLGMRVLKAGVGGFATRQELLKAEEIIEKVKQRPRLIILGYYIFNDIDDDYCFSHLTVVKGHLLSRCKLDMATGIKTIFSREELEAQIKNYERYGLAHAPTTLLKKVVQRIKWWFNKHSILYNYFKNVVVVRSIGEKFGAALVPSRTGANFVFEEHSKDHWLEKAWGNNITNVIGFKKLAEKYNVPLLIVIIPSKEQVYPFLGSDTGYTEKDWQRPNNRLREVLKNENILFLDLLPIFRSYADLMPRRFLDSKHDLYWKYDNHWNVKGNALAGLAMGQYILKNDLINVVERNQKLSVIEEALEELKNKIH